MISRRAQRIDASGIRKVFAMAAQLSDPVDLSIGQPDFEAFDDLRSLAKMAIDQGANRYAPSQGLPALRDKIREEYALGEDFDVCITSGVTGALSLAYLCLLDVGDEVLIPDPYFVVYKELASILGIQCRYFDTYPDFATNSQRIAAACGPETKAIVINSPSNPCGTTIAADELRCISDFAREQNIPLIYDEIYDAFSYDMAHPRLALHEQAIIVNGYSKTFGIPGWRLGYIIGPKAFIERCSTLQQYSFVCANSVGQKALSELGPVDFSAVRESYRARRDFVCERLESHYSFTKPEGAFYLFPEAPGGNGTDFVKRCIEKQLLVVPGAAFSSRDTHFRISFSASLETLERGVKILRDLA